MGDDIFSPSKLSIVDDEGNVIDTIGVTSIGADDIMPEEIGNKIAEEVFGGSVELDIKIPRMKRKRMKKLLMSEGYDRNTSEKLCNAYKNMYGSRNYLGLNFFLSYIKYLGDDMCILEI